MAFLYLVRSHLYVSYIVIPKRLSSLSYECRWYAWNWKYNDYAWECVILYALLPNNSFSGKKVVKSVLQLYVSSTMCQYYPLSFQDLGQLLNILKVYDIHHPISYRRIYCGHGSAQCFYSPKVTYSIFRCKFKWNTFVVFYWSGQFVEVNLVIVWVSSSYSTITNFKESLRKYNGSVAVAQRSL